ncbi:MAG: GTPase domain-containing protein [Promethearchaeota archaeon]
MSKSQLGSASIGQVGVFGSQGSGKTRIIQTLCQYYGKGDKYAWDEEKEMMGTTGVLPYILPLQNGKITIMDNPGQDNLDMVRSVVAQAGAGYKGLIIVIDDSARIFAPVSLSHADAISPFVRITEDQKIPVGVISNKSDFSEMLREKKIVSVIAEAIEQRMLYIQQRGEFDVTYYSRIYGKWESHNIKAQSEAGYSYLRYTEFEQVLVDILNQIMRNLPLSTEHGKGITNMNIRLLARAFTMGFYSLLLQSKLADADTLAFRGIGPSLYICLNHHRPTFWETGISWSDILSTKEPFVPLDIFTKENIQAILLSKILGTQSMHDSFIKQCESKPRLKIVSHVRTNVFEQGGGRLAQILEAVADGILSNEVESKKEEIFDLNGF